MDANVILEYFLGRERKEEVREIFLLIENGTIKAFTSTSIIQTCGYILLKTYNKLSARQILMGDAKNDNCYRLHAYYSTCSIKFFCI